VKVGVPLGAQAFLALASRQTALQILKTLARCTKTGQGNAKQLQGIKPPLYRLRAQDYRVFFRDQGEHLGSPASPAAKHLFADAFLVSTGKKDLIDHPHHGSNQ
jgi:hypothetical protein